MGEGGKLFFKVKCQLINIEGIMKSKSPFDNYHGNTCFRKESLMILKLVGSTLMRKKDICIVSKYFPIRYLLTKEK